MSAEPLVDAVLVVVGVAVLLVTAVDLLWTTLWPEGGAGPLTARISGGLWTVLSRNISQLNGSRAQLLLSLSGPVLLVVVVGVWVLLLYVGWAFIFSTADTGIVNSGSRIPASLPDRLYFAGYSLFTLGNGDMQPTNWAWQLATVLATANGLLLITLAVTYLIPIVSAATSKRALAGEITSLGTKPAAFVTTAWGRQGFAALGPQMASITSSLGLLGDQHLAYPVLHYFHNRPAPHSSALAVAVLDEALTLMRYGVAEHARPEPAVLATARQAVESYLDTLAKGFLPEGERTPEPPDLDAVRHAGIPAVTDEEFQRSLEGIAHRRRMLLGLVQSTGESWDALR